MNSVPQLFAAASKPVLKIDCDVTTESEMRSERVREVDAREIKDQSGARSEPGLTGRETPPRGTSSGDVGGRKFQKKQNQLKKKKSRSFTLGAAKVLTTTTV